ncbi:hypothetical protein CORC01_05398 [Colletotrichum orchidophilum]|uniref:Protein kinase domain-containing protein n=1 Tax=Colletotrichum orchidophilum TaxID=1209926 RepID=A0A1G4BDB2_9PEZI|nr:uncharacterized protein CORC01_05398 [Colletotrichum orchidophilum]OHE99357.1 hypothetical protein CORC01_05398 [Colletotrichum orchidophilum]
MVNSNSNDGINDLGEVVSRAEETARTLVDLANSSKTIQLQTRRQMNQLQSELTRTTALYRLIYNDIICHLETSSMTFLSLAPADLSLCRLPFRRINETLRVYEQSPAAAAPLTGPQYPKLVLETHRQLKALNDEIRADVVLAIKRVLNQGLFSRDTRAVQLRDIAAARDQSLEHDIWQIRIQRGDAPLIASLLLPNDPDTPDGENTPMKTPCLRFHDASTIVETREMPRDDPAMYRTTLKLATFLHATRSPYLLRCTNFRVVAHHAQNQRRRRRLEYIYDAAPLQGCRRGEIHRLSEHLGSPEGHFTRGRREAAARILSDKIRFAGSLARSLSELHAVDRVHGAVCAENVWFGVRGQAYEAKVSLPLLVGFGLEEEVEEEVRRCRVAGDGDGGGGVGGGGDDGRAALEEAKRRDILALGVLLLEIGLGRSVAEGGGPSASAATSASTSVASSLGVGAVAAAEHLGTLNAVMGGRYTAAVRAALDPRQLAVTFLAMDRGGGGGEDEGVAGQGAGVFGARGSCGLDRAFRGVVVDELLGVVGRA